MSVRLLLIVAGAAAVAWSYAHWKRAVQLAMVILVVEGALRKWAFPAAQDLVYFAKDVFLLGAYLGYLVRAGKRRSLAIPALSGLLALGAAYGVLQVFNPALPNVLVGLLGFKAYFFYVPLLFLLPETFDSDSEIALFLRRYIALAVPVGLLATAQFFSPPSSPLNTYARASDDFANIVTFGSSTFVRVTGTFSFITGYGTYLSVTVFLVLAVLATSRWRLRGNWPTYAAFGLSILGMLMTGSRGPLLMLVLLSPLYWWLAVARERGSTTTFGRILLGLGVVAGFLGFAAPDALGAFYGRAAGSTDLATRMISPFLYPSRIFSHAGLLGFGIGASHQTAAAVTKNMIPYSWLGGLLVEGETGRVMLEMGAIGFLLVYLVRVYLVFFAFRQTIRLRTRFHRAVATSSLLFFLAQLPGAVVFNVTSDVYYWFFAGLLVLAMRLDREVRPALARAATQSTRFGGLQPRLSGAGVPQLTGGSEGRSWRQQSP